ncbi:hypothetical protein BH23ACT11_BH23ACT11_09010 [soil metagenome]
MRLIAFLLLAALVAVLALTNPSQEDFADFLRTNASSQVEERYPGMGGLVDRLLRGSAGQMAAEAFERESYFVCSVYKLDLSSGRLVNAEFVFLGIAGRFVPLRTPDDVRNSDAD